MYKIISNEEYNKLWDSVKKNRMIDTNHLPSYHMKRITCLPYSGVGTPFKNEYDRLMHKAMNPHKPPYIRMVTVDGEEYIYPEAFRSYLEKSGFIKQNKPE